MTPNVKIYESLLRKNGMCDGFAVTKWNDGTKGGGMIGFTKVK